MKHICSQQILRPRRAGFGIASTSTRARGRSDMQEVPWYRARSGDQRGTVAALDARQAAIAFFGAHAQPSPLVATVAIYSRHLEKPAT